MTPGQRDAGKPPVGGQILAQETNMILAKDLIGQAVYASDKSKIGTISDLILSKDGKAVEGFVIGVGGFLGIGEKNVALRMDQLKISPGTNGNLQLTMDVKKDELTNAPPFKSRKDQEAEKQAERARTPSPAGPGAPTPGQRPGQ
jgi:sporulation protein YlmC with PRC-barrel domain